MTDKTAAPGLPLVLVVCLLLGCVEGPTSWYLIAGQSNAVGASRQLTSPADGLAWRLDGYDLLTFIADPYLHFRNRETGITSPWPSFAANHSGNVGLITAAMGGSCLLDWPTKLGRWSPDTGDLFGRAIDGWVALGSPQLEAVLWLQGECDASNGRAAGLDPESIQAMYRDALMELADRFHAETGAVMIAGLPSLRLCRYTNEDCDPALYAEPLEWVRPVIEGTLDAISLHPMIYLGPDTSDLRMGDDDDTGSAHVWDVNELGRRWATSVE